MPLSTLAAPTALRLTRMSKKSPEEVLRQRLRAIPHGENGRVAREAGVAEETLSRWKGRGGDQTPINPDLLTLQGLARALRVPLVALFEEEPAVPATVVAAAREKIVEAERLLADAQGAAEAHRRARGILDRVEKRNRRHGGGAG